MEPEDQVSLTVPVINKIKFTLCLADVLFELYQPFHLQLAWDLYFCVVQIPGNGVFSETLQSGQQQIFKLQLKMEIPHRSAKKGCQKGCCQEQARTNRPRWWAPCQVDRTQIWKKSWICQQDLVLHSKGKIGGHTGRIIKLDKDLAKLMGYEGFQGHKFDTFRMVKCFEEHYINEWKRRSPTVKSHPKKIESHEECFEL